MKETQNKNPEKVQCCLCGELIEHKGSWKWGNNAEPLVENGRCCDKCNSEKVIPERIRLVEERRKE